MLNDKSNAEKSTVKIDISKARPDRTTCGFNLYIFNCSVSAYMMNISSVRDPQDAQLYIFNIFRSLSMNHANIRRGAYFGSMVKVPILQPVKLP